MHLNKVISIILIIGIFGAFTSFEIRRKSEKLVLGIINPYQIEVDLNGNKVLDDGEIICIPNIKAFTSDISQNQTELEKLDNSAKEHLGIIYEPFDLLIYTVTLFTNLNDSTEIVLSAPAVSWKEHEIIPVTNFSFNQFFDQAPKFKEIHDIYLMSVDFIVIGLLLYLAYKKFKEVFNK